MVRTMRSIEEEARVRRVSGVGLDAYLSRGEFLDALDGPVLRDLKAFASEGVRRVLVVGLEDRGGLALSFASAGLFVTVVEPDEALVGQVRERAEREKCAMRMNLYASDYMKREFASSGFDLAVFYASLSRYNEPVVVVKKAARELRAGGRFFARVRVRPAWPGPEVRPGAVQRVASRIRTAASRIGFLDRFLAIPDAASFLKQVSEVLKVERSEVVHLVSPVLADLACRLPTEAARRNAARALKTLSSLERRALQGVHPARMLASYLVLFASKEMGLGRTFRL